MEETKRQWRWSKVNAREMRAWAQVPAFVACECGLLGEGAKPRAGLSPAALRSATNPLHQHARQSCLPSEPVVGKQSLTSPELVPPGPRSLEPLCLHTPTPTPTPSPARPPADGSVRSIHACGLPAGRRTAAVLRVAGLGRLVALPRLPWPPAHCPHEMAALGRDEPRLARRHLKRGAAADGRLAGTARSLGPLFGALQGL